MSASLVVPDSISWWGVPLVSCSMRAAEFVASPTAVYSTRRSEPTLPDITRPEFRPMPMRNPDPRSCSRSQALKRGRRTVSISRALAERAVGVVVLGDRRSEHGHDPVAHVGDERAPVVEDRVAHLAQVVVEHFDHPVRGQRFGERGEAAQVGEHDGPLALHPAEAQPRVGARENLVDDVLGHEAREQIAHPLALEGDRDELHRQRPGRAEDQRPERVHERHDAARR